MSTVYVLILFAHVGMLGRTDSNSMTTQEFTSAKTCKIAGEAARSLVRGTTKDIEFICVEK